MFEQMRKIGNWVPVWCSVLRLCGHREKDESGNLVSPWQAAVERFRTNLAQPIWWHRVGEMDSFETLEKMLRQHSPELVLTVHRGARIGLSVKASGIAEKIVGNLMVSIPIGMVNPIAGLAAGAAVGATQTTELAEEAGKAISDEIFKPLSKERIQASLFRLFHNS